MKVALGTLELDEDTRKKLGKAINGRSYLKREEAKEWALSTLNSAILAATQPAGPITPAQEEAAAPLPEPAAPTV